MLHGLDICGKIKYCFFVYLLIMRIYLIKNGIFIDNKLTNILNPFIRLHIFISLVTHLRKSSRMGKFFEDFANNGRWKHVVMYGNKML